MLVTMDGPHSSHPTRRPSLSFPFPPFSSLVLPLSFPVLPPVQVPDLVSEHAIHFADPFGQVRKQPINTYKQPIKQPINNLFTPLTPLTPLRRPYSERSRCRGLSYRSGRGRCGRSSLTSAPCTLCATWERRGWCATTVRRLGVIDMITREY